MTTKTDNEQLSPMQKKFNELKKKHPDAILLFRCGDFYETYEKDAEDAAKILGITLTKRNTKDGRTFVLKSMAGFPYHALDTYLPKLVRAGRRVCICDELEDPKKTKTLVKRGATEVVNPIQQTKTEETMTKEQEQALRSEYEKKIEDVQNAAKAKDIEIATATVKALGSNIPTQLNDHLATAIGKLELIKIKNRQNVKPFNDEMNYLINMAQKALDANL